jgi:DNA-directed RNA polymerase subunit RPC12/RpoP
VTRPKKRDYLIAHACFDCRKSFKVSPKLAAQICPDCGAAICFMGRSFKAPSKDDLSEWKKIEKLWNAGFRFWSYRSAPNAEPLPKRLSDVDDFIRRNADHPFRTGEAASV